MLLEEINGADILHHSINYMHPLMYEFLKNLSFYKNIRQAHIKTVAVVYILRNKAPQKRPKTLSTASYASPPSACICLTQKISGRPLKSAIGYDEFKLYVSELYFNDNQIHQRYYVITRFENGCINSINFLKHTKTKNAGWVHVKPIKAFGKSYLSFTAFANYYHVPLRL